MTAPMNESTPRPPLLLCPFCPGEVRYTINSRGVMIHVGDYQCPLGASTYNAEKWNRRALPPGSPVPITLDPRVMTEAERMVINAAWGLYANRANENDILTYLMPKLWYAIDCLKEERGLPISMPTPSPKGELLDPADHFRAGYSVGYDEAMDKHMHGHKIEGLEKRTDLYLYTLAQLSKAPVEPLEGRSDLVGSQSLTPNAVNREFETMALRERKERGERIKILETALRKLLDAGSDLNRSQESWDSLAEATDEAEEVLKGEALREPNPNPSPNPQLFGNPESLAPQSPGEGPTAPAPALDAVILFSSFQIACNALEAISKNSCCEPCQEAKRVAADALHAIEYARPAPSQSEGSPAPDPLFNRFGVDADYFRRELATLSASLDNRQGDELARYLRRLSDVAASAPLDEEGEAPAPAAPVEPLEGRSDLVGSQGSPLNALDLEAGLRDIRISVMDHMIKDRALSPHGATQSFRAGQIDGLDQASDLILRALKGEAASAEPHNPNPSPNPIQGDSK